jgi:hypothetical protein
MVATPCWYPRLQETAMERSHASGLASTLDVDYSNKADLMSVFFAKQGHKQTFHSLRMNRP